MGVENGMKVVDEKWGVTAEEKKRLII